jgi:branched-chain amino acid transport system ATP-binding protein
LRRDPSIVRRPGIGYRFGVTHTIRVHDLELPGRDIETRRVSLELEPGDVVGIAGPPGVGKSSLLRMLSGSVPARAATFEVLGIDATREPRRVWECVGYLRGDRESFLWHLSVRDNLRRHGSLKRLQGATLDRAVGLQLRRVGLLSRAGAAPRFLERDDRLRLAMAQAWLDEPRLLLLDDPLHGAGAAVAEQFVSSLEQWMAEDPERSVVVVGRSLRPFISLLTRAYLLRERWLAPTPPWDLP